MAQAESSVAVSKTEQQKSASESRVLTEKFGLSASWRYASTVLISARSKNLWPAAILFGIPRLWNACSIGRLSAPYLTTHGQGSTDVSDEDRTAFRRRWQTHKVWRNHSTPAPCRS